MRLPLKSVRRLPLAATAQEKIGLTEQELARVCGGQNTRLDLYRIDLASVVSRYIGETEKNLGRLF